MSGDRLSDLVRIRQGFVAVWPNLGYGRFGAKIEMDGAPLFAPADEFSQARIRLADVDGSGFTNIVYPADDAAVLYANGSGEGQHGQQDRHERLSDDARAKSRWCDCTTLAGQAGSCRAPTRS
jgi:hypothetical protein